MGLNINLLDPDLFQRFNLNPGELREVVLGSKNKYEWVFIDEVQKIPVLLDLVHDLIEKTKIKFALSGSSARKLKRGGANLLAGRAYSYSLYPFTFTELGEEFDLNSVLQWGS